MYHRVCEKVRGVAAPTLNVTPQQLRRQLAGLLARGFVSWPLTSLVAAHVESRPVPANVFAVTFDDGYENNYIHAYPILRELNVPATIFVATKYLDTNKPFPFDDWSATGSDCTPPSAWRPLSTSQCREMLAGGLIEFGAHTHSHRRFMGRCSAFVRDMKLCLEVLRDRFCVIRPTFAFPYGEMNWELVEAARQLDISCAVTVQHSRVRSNDDPFQWGRFYVGQSDTPAMLAAKLSGWYPMLTTAGKKVMGRLSAMSRVASCPVNTAPHRYARREDALTRKAQSQS
jgi:peptidoglycan/xylan/chitin deacetylase (PgdA/CDA1 family)